MSEIIHRTRAIGQPALFALYVLTVAGGPFGTEAAIAESGRGMSVLLFVLVPLLWGLPAALVSAELASTYPIDGGPYAWTKRAFGPVAAAVGGWAGWVTSWIGLATFPVLFAKLLTKHFSGVDTGIWRWAIAVTVVRGVFVNSLGARSISAMAVGGVVGTFIPVIALWVVAGSKATHNPLRPIVNEGRSVLASLGVGLFIVMWNCTGWDSVALVAGDVRNPQRSYPRAIGWALVATTTMYVATLALGLAATAHGTVAWDTGSWLQVARSLGGSGLETALLMSGLIAAACQFGSILYSTSQLPRLLAEDHLLPLALGRRARNGVPVRALILCGVIISVLCALPFEVLAVGTVVTVSIGLFFQFGALARFRKVDPATLRPFRIPLAGRACSLLALPIVVVLAVALWQTVRLAGAAATIGVPALLLAPAMLLARRAHKQTHAQDC